MGVRCKEPTRWMYSPNVFWLTSLTFEFYSKVFQRTDRPSRRLNVVKLEQNIFDDWFMRMEEASRFFIFQPEATNIMLWLSIMTTGSGHDR